MSKRFVGWKGMEPHYYSYEDYPFDTGAIAWPVSTSNEKAQGWFNRGLAWCCGFNHEEAIICFDSAVQEEDDFLMGHWALVWANGPNYNLPIVFEEGFPSYSKAQKHLAKAKELVKGGKGNEMEQMLVNAMECRFPTPFTMDEEVRAKHDMEYKEAMKLLYEKFPDHPHIALLYVEALMQLSPWQLYDTVTCEPVESAREAVEILERMISVHKEHPGLLHLYMHLMEMSKDPGKALLALEPLRDGLVPASGHLYHVPSHIDVLLGRYHEAIIANKRALPSDRKIGEIRGSNNWYLLYRLHDFHFIVYSGMMLGNFELAMEAAEEIHRTVPKEALKIQARADWFEGFLTTKVHLLVRFGKWQQLLHMLP